MQEQQKAMGDKKSLSNNGRIITYCVVSVLLFGLLFWFTYSDGTENAGTQTVEIVAFGDSVLGEIRDETAVPVLLEEKIGKTVYNAAMGGTCIARMEEDRRLDYPKGALSFVGLSKAFLAGDFGVQQSIKFRESNMEYFAEVIEGLRSIDAKEVEIVLIQQGLNDYHAGTPIENPENPYDEYTFLGAIRTGVEALRKVNPDVRIVIITPTYTWYTFTGLTCEESDNGGGVLEDYVNAELEVARQLGVEVVDVYHDFFPHDTWEDYTLYTRDGLHPNEAGRQMLAERIAEVLSR